MVILYKTNTLETTFLFDQRLTIEQCKYSRKHHTKSCKWYSRVLKNYCQHSKFTSCVKKVSALMVTFKLYPTPVSKCMFNIEDKQTSKGQILFLVLFLHTSLKQSPLNNRNTYSRRGFLFLLFISSR